MKFNIYKLVNKNDEVFYVGSTVQKIERRLSAHLYEAKRLKTKKDIYISENKNIKIILIEIVDSELESSLKEISWLKYYKDLGCDMKNNTNGGEISKRIGLKHTEESKKLMSINSKGQIISEERKKLMSELTKGKLNVGKKASDETKEKLREIAKLRVCSDEKRKKCSLASKKFWSDEEKVEVWKERSKKTWTEERRLAASIRTRQMNLNRCYKKKK